MQEGLEPKAVRAAGERIESLGKQVAGIQDDGNAMLKVLAAVWEGPDLGTFESGWSEAGPQVAQAAETLRAAGAELRRQAEDQVRASDGEGGRGGGGGGWGWPDWDLPDFDFPDLNPFDGWDWDLPDIDWPDIDLGKMLSDFWDGFLDLLDGIGDWWDDIPWWGQLIIGVVAVVVIAVVIAVVLFFAGLEIAAVLGMLGTIALVVGAIMTILDLLDEIAEFLRDPKAAIEKFLNDPLAVLDDLIWLVVGALPLGIGKVLQRLRKPLKELFENAAPWLKKKWDDIAAWGRKKVDDISRAMNDWEKGLRKKYSLGAKDLADPPAPKFDDQQLKKKHKHAPDFGVEKNYNAKNAEAFKKALDDHMNDPRTRHIDGSYQGKPAILDYNPDTGLVVVRKPNGEFVSGWKATGPQAKNIEERGSL